MGELVHESKVSSYLKLHWSSNFSIDFLVKAAIVKWLDVPFTSIAGGSFDLLTSG